MPPIEKAQVASLASPESQGKPGGTGGSTGYSQHPPQLLNLEDDNNVVSREPGLCFPRLFRGRVQTPWLVSQGVLSGHCSQSKSHVESLVPGLEQEPRHLCASQDLQTD